MDAHCETDPGQRCITCSDEGVVMRVLDLDMGTGVARFYDAEHLRMTRNALG